MARGSKQGQTGGGRPIGDSPAGVPEIHRHYPRYARQPSQPIADSTDFYASLAVQRDRDDRRIDLLRQLLIEQRMQQQSIDIRGDRNDLMQQRINNMLPK